MKKLLALAILGILVLKVQGFANATENKVLVLEINGIITKGTLEQFKEALKEAEEINAEALILTLDTPGGGVEETIEITKLIQKSDIPIISYVYPKAATAWSAGTFILVSSHITAMAPQTIIGSAQPVDVSSGRAIPVNESKIINALLALIKENSRNYGRNETTVERFITENLNLNPEKAKELGVIEVIANNIKELLEKIDGMEVKIGNGRTLNTKNARIVKFQVPLKLQFLGFIANPLIASLLLIIGFYAIIFGISTPGYGSEILGAIMIILGLMGLGFNINYLAVALFIIGAALILLEVSSPGFGVFGIGGIIALAFGGIFLVPLEFPAWHISPAVRNEILIAISIPSILLAGFVIFITAKVLQIRRRKSVVGEIIGAEGYAIDSMGQKKEGYVKIRGEYWVARSKQRIRKGDKIKVVGKDGHILIVEKVGVSRKL